MRRFKIEKTTGNPYTFFDFFLWDFYLICDVEINEKVWMTAKEAWTEAEETWNYIESDDLKSIT